MDREPTRVPWHIVADSIETTSKNIVCNKNSSVQEKR